MALLNEFKGKVWKFGDSISTDLIMPGFAVLSRPDLSPEEASEYCMISNRPGWASKVKPGDIIVAGKNFGCGSSRPASKILKALGIRTVVAESISRIFLRNSIDIGFPVLVCPGITDNVEEGDVIEIDLETGKILNLTEDTVCYANPLPKGSPPMEILKAGGIINYLKLTLNEENK